MFFLSTAPCDLAAYSELDLYGFLERMRQSCRLIERQLLGHQPTVAKNRDKNSGHEGLLSRNQLLNFQNHFC